MLNIFWIIAMLRYTENREVTGDNQPTWLH